MLSLTLLLIVFVAIILTIIWFTLRRLKREKSEPIIELEKLVHCKSCGSLIPETAGRCAFCGKSQTGN